MSHIPMPVLDQKLLDQYTALFRGDRSIAQPEQVNYEYLIAMTNMWRADETTFNISLLVIDTITPDMLDYFTHGHFNSGNFDYGPAQSSVEVGQMELVGMPVWDAM